MSLLDAHREREYSLSELVQAADSILSTIGGDVADGRISAQPDARTIRYYQTTGLLAKPIRYDGRNAVYGYRHLLQVVCIKKLQTEGYSLSVIQRGLTGRSDTELEEKLSSVLGSAPTKPGHVLSVVPPSRPEPARRRLISLEVAPGVTLTIDPDLFEEPDKTSSDLASVLADFLERKL